MRYRLLFPVHRDEEKQIDTLAFIITPDHIGIVNNVWWHGRLERTFGNIREAQTFGNRIKRALKKGELCPCEEDHCWFRNPDKAPRASVFIFPNDPRSAR